MKYFKALVILFSVGLILGLTSVAGLYFYFKSELPSVEVLKDVKLQTPMQVFSKDGKLISQYGVKKRIPLTLEQMPQQLINAVLATEDSRFYDHPGIDPIGVMRAALNLLVTGDRSQGASTLTMQLARGFFLTRDKKFTRKIKEVFIAWHIERILSKDEILSLYLNKIELGHRAFGVGAAAQVYYGKDIGELSLAQIATIAGLPKAPSTLNPISRPERSKQRRRVVLLRMLDEGFITRGEFDLAANAEVTAARHGAEIQLDAPYLAEMVYNEMVNRYGREEAETGGYRVYATAPSHLQAAAQNAVRQNLHDYDERHGYRGPLATLWEPLELVLESINDPSIDLLSEWHDPTWDEATMLGYLNTKPRITPLYYGIVVEAQEQRIRVFDATGVYRDIGWDGLAWARPFIDDRRQGSDPKLATDIVQEGQLVMIRQRDDDGQWQLSQLPQVAGAMVALEPNNGALQAVVGGYSYYQSQFNRALQAKRQVGSNIKPFLYSAALENGYTLATVINDAPINQWDRKSGIAWRPKNSPEVYDGPIRMRRALGRSKNVVSVRLLRGVGLDKVINHLGEFGFNPNELPRDESLSLGSASLTPYEVATGFATIANGGFAVEPYVIDHIEDQQGNILWEANPMVACLDCLFEANDPSIAGGDKGERADVRYAPQVISSQNAFLVSEMMRTAVAGEGSWAKKTYWQGTGWRAKNILKRDDLYGKTGTTNDAKDTWFSGFGGGMVATAWFGFDDMSRALGRTSVNRYLVNQKGDKANWIGNAMFGGEDGARVAQPAWIRFMQVALEDKPERQKMIPADIVTVRVDRSSGKLTPRTDHTALFEYFAKGTEPQQWVDLDKLKDPLDEGDANADEEDEIF